MRFVTALLVLATASGCGGTAPASGAHPAPATNGKGSGSSSGDTSGGAGANTRPAGTPSGTSPVDPAQPAHDVTGAGTSGSQSFPDVPVQDESKLPVYLFKKSELATLVPLVEPYAPNGNAPELEPSAPQYDGARGRFEDFLNQAMKVPFMAPGRDFTVVVPQTDEVNASADAFQVIRINSATLTFCKPDQLLAVLCHEIGHSIRNHSVKGAQATRADGLDPKIDKLYADGHAFVDQHYDDARGVYKHDKAAYKAAIAAWDALRQYTDMVKGQESTADLTGAIMCAKLGMPPDNYINGMYTFFKDGAAAGAAKQKERFGGPVQDGQEITVGKDEVFSLLFSFDDHPAVPERIGQLVRLKSEWSAYYDPAQTLYAQWAPIFKAALPAGATLVERPATFKLRRVADER